MIPANYNDDFIKISNSKIFPQDLLDVIKKQIKIYYDNNKQKDKVEEIIKIGETILVKAIGKDKKGKENFSRIEVLKNKKKKKSE